MTALTLLSIYSTTDKNAQCPN